MSETNAERARRGYEAVLRGDFDVIGELLHPDVRWHGGDPDAAGACRSREQALTFMRRALGHGAPGELVDVIEAGERVVVIIRPSSVDGGPMPLVANLSTFRDGQVVEMVHYPDPEAALAATRR